MSSWAVMFPGQGAQYVGMGRPLWDASLSAKRTFEEADDALHYALSDIIFNGPESRLQDTEIQQPAILVVSVAAWRAFHEEFPDLPVALGLGLSLGEYSAYVAAGVMSLADAARVTRIRGQAMQEAVPRGLGGMTAILGLMASDVEALCEEASAVAWVQPANYNAPGQIVVSGLVAGLERVEELARAQGARVIRLAVSAPFHSRLLEPAGAVLSKALATVPLTPAAFPVIANVDAELCEKPSEIIPRLITQVSHPVRFQQSVEKAIGMNVTGFLEFGPGRSLSSLLKKIDRRQKVGNVEDEGSLRKALELAQGPGYNS
ncbi:MAG: [acyl-carrier-protein] S-malonyltransferase [Sulfobacillus thermosulfidooxidans]|uniref:Malonyl CoA-acyl carrier protein transacylase n=1 Tax=Sulfobacillus thermotolerans TaxID=338644 RepID=A0ABM6RT45_9FIRM|nr:ACP S-malonyltransferase [Sulfobacillus sp. hq2]AUW94526.1 [acyl-carrier-protein] S-malonyltransferase [Sulfobacillus thermotolerans]MCY0908059.1 ACP S-malonyltransferase [Sulfobacillus thermotolerans]POB09179.1 [acyl-carrier-protein] S-malonyltransferase [Sulfobacillus sp. hq2]PSR36901.1 MAG: [acyl-carrier-protein] S-malonyltransferase [Sulfobacillus thermosulfidooxidans]